MIINLINNLIILKIRKINHKLQTTLELKAAAQDLRNSQISLKAQLAASEARENSLKSQIGSRRENAIADSREKRSLIQKLKSSEQAVGELTEEVEQLNDKMQGREMKLSEKIKRLKVKIPILEVVHDNNKCEVAV